MKPTARSTGLPLRDEFRTSAGAPTRGRALTRPAASQRRKRALPGTGGRPRDAAGEEHMQGGALVTSLGLRPDAPAVGLDDRMQKVQAEPEALCAAPYRLLCSAIALEQSRD